MEKTIHFRAVIEVLGKPKEHVEKAMQEYVEKLRQNERYEIISEEIAKIKKQDEQELWAIFSELEIKAEKIEDLVGFCFEYMPSLIEIITPKELTFSDVDISHFLSDMQAKLHQVDMVAKQVNIENQHLKQNLSGLLKNYIQILLNKGNLTGEQLSGLTGVTKDRLEDFLDQLIDERKIDLKEGIYFLKEKEV